MLNVLNSGDYYSQSNILAKEDIMQASVSAVNRLTEEPQRATSLSDSFKHRLSRHGVAGASVVAKPDCNPEGSRRVVDSDDNR